MAERAPCACESKEIADFMVHSEHGAGRSMDGLDQDDPATW
jgi:hypothetical protein